MEPCLFRHGKPTNSGHTARNPAQLQWSHVFSDMVRVDERVLIIDPVALQWSHVFSDMVRRDADPALLGADQASMEPCLFRHGKSGHRPDLSCRVRRFNGAMSFQTW